MIAMTTKSSMSVNPRGGVVVEGLNTAASLS
jgi:hypothetical protein